MSKAKPPGSHSLAEILSQPACWGQCLAELDRSGRLASLAQRFASATEWLFIGCGSSYYAALSAAATMARLAGCRARALPASEVLLHPETVLNGDGGCVSVLISRSGQTSEVISAAGMLKRRGITTLAISCAAGQPLEELADEAIILAPADEQSTVMTRSFTSMLLALQALAAARAKTPEFLGALHAMPEAAAGVLSSLPALLEEFSNARRFADYVYLGQGPLYGMACEGALKITEMSVSYAQSFHTLEFRHGPKSIVAPETLLVFLLSQTGYDAECEALIEMKALGATTLVIANQADDAARRASDLLIELGIESHELARVAPYIFAPQLLGLFTGINKGYDPDSPRNLSRVVMLDDEKPRPKPEHAAI